MKKSAGKTTSGGYVSPKTNETQSIKKAKKIFFTGLIDISWRLSLAIIIPVVAGNFLDNKQDTGNLYTLIGLFSGTILAGFIIYKTSKKLNKEINEL